MNEKFMAVKIIISNERSVIHYGATAVETYRSGWDGVTLGWVALSLDNAGSKPTRIIGSFSMNTGIIYKTI